MRNRESEPEKQRLMEMQDLPCLVQDLHKYEKSKRREIR